MHRSPINENKCSLFSFSHQDIETLIIDSNYMKRCKRRDASLLHGDDDDCGNGFGDDNDSDSDDGDGDNDYCSSCDGRGDDDGKDLASMIIITMVAAMMMMMMMMIENSRIIFAPLSMKHCKIRRFQMES